MWPEAPLPVPESKQEARLQIFIPHNKTPVYQSMGAHLFIENLMIFPDIVTFLPNLCGSGSKGFR
ncbi:hypothetical protein DT594_17390 [Halopseudomonas laoshanensis]|uniref:Uncharacterized protein n=1 Tax=Halopseudomonas laoshanensis TaxID=2268758 RepID=A0A7V7KSZ1_9GAMM|nr:hypothetical protein DT594_17390 [Halopseudomonas laoshanensis]